MEKSENLQVYGSLEIPPYPLISQSSWLCNVYVGIVGDAIPGVVKILTKIKTAYMVNGSTGYHYQLKKYIQEGQITYDISSCEHMGI